MPSHLVPFTIGGTEFRVEPRYTLNKQVGAGAYGVVASADDAGDARGGGGGGAPDFTSSAVAIKKVGHAYADLVDAKRILREIKLLRSLGGHENVVALHDLFDDHDDVYIVTKLLDTDLHRILYSKQKLTEQHTQYFLYQILRGLKYMHSAGVLCVCVCGGGAAAVSRGGGVPPAPRPFLSSRPNRARHRDLKPSNLLLNSVRAAAAGPLAALPRPKAPARSLLAHPPTHSPTLTAAQNCDLRICDLGLARAMQTDGDCKLTEYVVTRWYRAPEIMLSCECE